MPWELIGPNLLELQAESELGRRLQAVANSGALNLKLLGADSLAEAMLPGLLPRQWKGQEAMAWEPTAAGEQFNAEELQKLWALLATLPDLSALQEWPLVPVHRNTLCQFRSPSKVRSSISLRA